MAKSDDMPAGPKPEPRRKRNIFSTEDAAPQAKKKGWDRSGQVSVVLGKERHARLKESWAENAGTYGTVADLVREAIDEKLDRLN